MGSSKAIDRTTLSVTHRGGERTAPLSAKMPLRYTRTTAMTMLPGSRAVFPKTSLVVGPDLRCWIDPLSVPVEKVQRLSGTINSVIDTISLERTTEGFRVDLSMIRTPFEIGGMPEPKHGIPWIPVIDLICTMDERQF
jgi:hypothetical protein